MTTLDLRKCPLGRDSEDFLAMLISQTCGSNMVLRQLSLMAKQDFGWENGNLMPYVLAGVVGLDSSRIGGFLSSSEWLNGILTSGDELSSEHLRILMMYINSNTGVLVENYVSGKELWKDAPLSIKTILDMIDDVCVENKSLKVIMPNIVPINEMDDLDDLAALPLDELRGKVRAVWVD